MAKKNRKRQTPAGAAGPSPAVEARIEPSRAARSRPPVEPLAAASPGAIGAYLGIGIGLSFVVLGVLGALRADPLPAPLVLALWIAGALEAVLCWQTIRRSRVAWSFAVALSGTVTLATLFGAPKIRDAMSVSIGIAALPALLAVLATILLAMAVDEMTSRS